MEPKTNIEQTVMRRVYRARVLAPVVTATPALVLVLASLYGIGREVWVARVFANAPSTLDATLSFFASAFLHTELSVQVLALAVVFSTFWLARDLARALSSINFVRVSRG